MFVKPRYAVQIKKCVIIYPADHMCNMFHPKRRMEILKMIVLFSANLDVLCLFVQLSMGDKIFVLLMGDFFVGILEFWRESQMRLRVIFIVILRELVLLLDE